MTRYFHNFVEWVGGGGLIVLVAMLVVVSGTWGFVALLGEVKEGDTQRFDEWTMRAVEPLHAPRYRIMEETGRDITALGGIPVLTLFTLVVVGYLLMIRKYGAMWLVLIATLGGLALSSGLKALVERPRPEISIHLSQVYTSSFPSGHSMMSAVVYLTLGSLLARIVPQRRVKLYFILIAIFLTFIVGISRIYMGVHWPTDVLAGWTAGLVWAILCWLIARHLQRHGAVETDENGGANSNSDVSPS